MISRTRYKKLRREFLRGDFLKKPQLLQISRFRKFGIPTHTMKKDLVYLLNILLKKKVKQINEMIKKKGLKPKGKKGEKVKQLFQIRNMDRQDIANAVEELTEPPTQGVIVDGIQIKISTEVETFANFKRLKVKLNPAPTNLRQFYNKIIDTFEIIEGDRNEPRELIVIYMNKEKQKPRFVTVRPESMIVFEDFEEFIDNMAEGEVVGSDATPVDNYLLLINLFYVNIVVPVAGGSSGKSPYFKLAGIKSNGLCGYECLKNICGDDFKLPKKHVIECLINTYVDDNQKELTTEGYMFDDGAMSGLKLEEIKKQIVKKYGIMDHDDGGEVVFNKNMFVGCKGNELKYLLEIIKKLEKRITIIGDIIDIPRIPIRQFAKDSIKFKKDGRSIRIKKLEKFGYKVLGKNSNNNNIIVYSLENKHYDVFEGVKDDLYYDYRLQIYEKVNNEKGEVEYMNVVSSKKEIAKSKLYETRIEKQKTEQRYLIVDFEGVIDFKDKNMTKPYAVAFLDLKYIDLKRLSAYDKSKNIDKIKQLVTKSGKFYLGYDCVDKLYKYMNTNNKYVYTFLTFNGCNYDNFLLYNGFRNINKDSVSNPFYNGTRLMNFSMWGKNRCFDIRKHVLGSLKDCCNNFKINTCAKKSFDHFRAQKLHDQGILIETLQKEYDAIREYNLYDVLSLGVLYYRYSSIIGGIKGLKEYGGDNLKNHMTISSMMMKLIRNHWKEQKHIIPKFHVSKKEPDCVDVVIIKNIIKKYGDEAIKTILKKCTPYGKYHKFSKHKQNRICRKLMAYCKDNYKMSNDTCVHILRNQKHFKLVISGNGIEILNKRLMKYYNDIQKSKSAGRVQLFNGIQKIIEPCVSLDACSLYPYVMAVMNVWYPAGKIKEVKTINQMKDDKIGFFYCDIDQKPLLDKDLPCVLPKKEKFINNWASSDKLEKYLISTVKINQLRKYGAKVVTYNGFYFTKKIKGCDLFRPILALMGIKNAQDLLKRADDKRYNAILREVVKLAMNSVSGKLIEGMHLDSIEEVNKYDLLELSIKKTDNLNIIKYNGSTALVSYKKNQFEEMKHSKPIYLGVLVYDYAQQHMYDSLYAQIPKVDRLYTDTDSLKTPEKAFIEWEKLASKTIVPHWEEVEEYDPRYATHPLYSRNSKVFGSFENEYDEKTKVNYFIDKKNYLSYFSDKGDFKDNCKMSFKGVSKNDVMVTQGNDDKGTFIEVTIDLNQIDMVEGDIDKIGNDTKPANWTVRRFYKNDTNDSQLFQLYGIAQKIHHDPIRLFEQLYITGKASLLTQCLMRSVKNSQKVVINNGETDKNKEKTNTNTIVCSTRIKNIRLRSHIANKDFYDKKNKTANKPKKRIERDKTPYKYYSIRGDTITKLMNDLKEVVKNKTGEIETPRCVEYSVKYRKGCIKTYMNNIKITYTKDVEGITEKHIIYPRQCLYKRYVDNKLDKTIKLMKCRAECKAIYDRLADRLI